MLVGKTFDKNYGKDNKEKEKNSSIFFVCVYVAKINQSIQNYGKKISATFLLLKIRKKKRGRSIKLY